MNYIELISTLGFPIIACISMAWYVKYITDKNYEETKTLNENHTKEMLTFKDEMKTALINNTKALEKLCEKIDNRG